MQYRKHPGLANALFVAVSAAAIVVPLPAAYCAQARGAGCCCKSHSSAANVGSIHCHPLPTVETASVQTCVGRTCGCHWVPNPQNTPPERVQSPTGSVAFLPADVTLFHGGIEFASALEPDHAGHLTAIPHRILHCIWLI